METEIVQKTKKTVSVHGRNMAYIEHGDGDAIVFVHGNPTSSYLWRDVMHPLEGCGRLIAPDLIGMGDSEKLSPAGPDTYRFATHARYFAGFMEQVLSNHDRVILVIHDWGSALGFNWAFENQTRVRGIAYMEGFVRPISGWDQWNPMSASIFQGFRSDKGEHLVLERNIFVEKVLPGSIQRKLTEEEMTEYRRPFLSPNDRWPTLSWPRELPIGGEPADVVAIVEQYSRWLSTSTLPKLFVNAEPGAVLIGGHREFCRTWPQQTEVTVPGSHFIQEDSGEQIGREIRTWLKSLRP
ncbi:haloalkane dehalogenase [Nevskia soli]|uniref:haloalkane dehalogenase n=1 Tax=Nevskia soli TaxID=418856 RepID=UPI0004A6B94C|nr:haloalkane dehalogenase [Nevskia soli]